MKVFFSTSIKRERPVMLAIGMFDGLHIAHMKLISETVEKARRAGVDAAVYTFSTHPDGIFGGGGYLLTPPREKLRLLKRAGADVVIMPPFTAELSHLSPDQFIDSLMSGLNINTVFIGYDFRFGKGRKGDSELLISKGKALGFSVDVMEPVMIDGTKVSSTQIRAKLDQGNMPGAARLLGRPYSALGIVVQGKQLGRTIGMPTANLEVGPEKLLPRKGVYACYACLERQKLIAVTNVGINPTVAEGEQLKVEAHIPGFVGNIYSQPLEIEFVRHLRDERKFDNLDDLKAQMQRDVNEAKSVMGSQERQ